MIDDLTPAQSDTLLSVTRFQRQKKQELPFTILTGALQVKYKEEFSLMIPRNAKETWQKLSYVTLTEGQVYREDPNEPGSYFAYEGTILTLTRKALDYERWMRNPAFVRFILRQLDQSFDRRSLITGVTVGIITTLLVEYILRLLSWV